MTIDGVTGLISWTPQANQTGEQHVMVQVSDGHGGTANQGFTMYVSAPPPNRPPTAQDDQYGVRRQQTLTVPAPGVLGNDSDPDGQNLTAHLVTGPSKGDLNLATDGSFTYAPAEPPPGSIEPMLKFGFTDPTNTVAFTTSQPIVVDLDKDGVPDIVFVAWNSFVQRRLIAVRGDTGAQLFSVDVYQPNADPPLAVEQGVGLAAGDLDGDGFPEILVVSDPGTNDPSTSDLRRFIVAFNHDGTVKWRSDDIIDGTNLTTTTGFTKPLIANILGDAKPEIAVGYVGRGPQTPAGIIGQDFVTVFDNQGHIVWTAQGGGGSTGQPSPGNVIAQDIDLDGNLEILFSDDVFDNQGHLLWSAFQFSDGVGVQDVAVVNLDDDPFGEIVYLTTSFSQLYVYDHTGAKKWGPVSPLPISELGFTSLMTIADADGDGTPEILVPGISTIAVVKADGTLQRTITPPYRPLGGNPTVFDLNGDGKPEIIYNAFDGSGGIGVGDLIILDGPTGAFLYGLSSPRLGSTLDPGTIVADVDGDGTAEIVTGGSTVNALLHVFKAKTGPWAQTRPVYNQLSYHITNVNSDGTIPAHEAINWLTPGLNNYRINVPLPQERTDDKDQFTYKANDGALDSNTATVRIDIRPPNHAPSILSQPPNVAAPNIEYLYAVRAVDPDVGEVLTFSLPQAPTGMSIDSVTGLIRWTPTAAQLGRHMVAAKVTDSQGESDFQGYAIEVVSPVTVPNVVGQAQAAAAAAITGTGLLVGTAPTSPSASVPAGDVIGQEPASGTSVPLGSAVNLVISSGPIMVIVPDVVGQTQAAAQTALTTAGLAVGTVTTAASTTVPAGSIISQMPAAGTSVPLGTVNDLVVSTGLNSLQDLASIIVEPGTPLILVGLQQALTATGVFSNGTSQDLTAIVTWTSSSPSIAAISPAGVATGAADGATTIGAAVGAITGTTTLTVRAKVAGDTTPPTALITAPAGDAEITSPVDVIGTATDANFLKYVLEYAPAGETTFTELATGDTPVTNSVLGQFDPTLLINDQYTLRLTVFDLGGNQSSAAVVVQAAREKKVGLFSITFQDLNVALSGLPITINRTYDSRDKGKGDFGIGWRLDIQTIRIRANRVLGTGWVRGQSGAVVTLSPTDAHKVSLTLPDGKVEEFDLQVSPTSGLGSLDFTSVTGFTPRSGTLGTLEALANNSLLILNAGAEDELVDDGTLNTYNPQLFRYTTAEGTQIEIHQTQGVQKVTDRNGNTLTFGPNGILHSAGQGVTFTRDAQGRITQMTDPLGNTQTYTYDANGDLIGHLDAVGNASRYAYNHTHGLIDIQDPAGNHPARNEYDAQGRLIATTDAQGNRIELTHDTAAAREIVRDRLGNPTVFEYDAVGNVTAKTDALGHVTTYTYDGQGNQLTETDPLGRVASKTYDAQRNVLSSTDFDGNTTTNTYNARNQVLTTTDPEGKVTTNVCDANGNLTQVTDPEGGVTQHTYDAAGNRLSTTDPLGKTTTFTYDALGHKTSQTDALGNVSTFSSDGNGNVLSATNAAGGTTQFQYDAAQRLIKVIDAFGHETVTTYSTVGDGQKPALVSDVNGQVTRFDYDARGNLVSKLFADGSTETTGYDAENNILSKTNRDGHTTAFQYDALGRQTAITNADGTSSTKTYDPVGRLLTQTNELGKTTSYDYALNKQTVTDALGNMTVHAFDSHQRRIKTTDALGHVMQLAYDSKGNLAQTGFADGSTATVTYDLAGRKVAETDQAGQTTHFDYDAVGHLVAVTDAAGGVTAYTYDAVGNRVTQTDANGHLTSLEYDALGRVTKRTRPLGQFETFVYDAKANQSAHTDFNGQTITFAYDANNRLSGKTLPGGDVIPFAYTAEGLRTLAGGDSYVYDARGRLTTETKASGDVLTYTYDAAGNRTSVTTPQGTTTYTYDALNRLSTVVDASGTTAYTYDAVGNLASTAYPNGATTTYTYDTLNRLVEMANSTIGGLLSSYTYTLGPAGNRLQVVEAGPATTGRTVVYTYDAVYRLTEELIDEAGTANDQAIRYVYDAVGNRTQIDRNGLVTLSTYDANDRLLTEATGSDTVTAAFDANGSLLSRTAGSTTDSYSYDAENRLVAASVQSGANVGTVSYIYDADGMRTSQTAAGVTTSFLLDKNREFAEVLVETTGGMAATYTYGHELVSQTRPDTGTRFYQYDGQLSTRQLTTTAGNLTDAYTYDAFGVLLSSSGTTPNAYLYVGEQLDPNVGFYYLRARYYAQAQGRFITTDPEEGRIFDPASLHRYLYVHADPVNNRDPSGRALLTQTLVVTTLINLIVSILVGIAEGVKQQSLVVGFEAGLENFGEGLLFELLLGGGGLAIQLLSKSGKVVQLSSEGLQVLKLLRQLVRSATENASLRTFIENLRKFKSLDQLSPEIANLVKQLGKAGLCQARDFLNEVNPGHSLGTTTISLTKGDIVDLKEIINLLLKFGGEAACKE